MKFNYIIKPFHYLGGVKLLIIAVVAAISGGTAAELLDIHFTGTLNLKFVGNPAFQYSQIIESVYITTVFNLLTLASGFLLKKRIPRVVDVWGTLGVARIPLMASMMFFPIFGIDQAATMELLENLQQNPDVVTASLQKLIFFAFCSLPFLIYSVYLHYHAFAVCTNTKGTRSVLTFIIVFIVAELIVQFSFRYLFTASMI